MRRIRLVMCMTLAAIVGLASVGCTKREEAALEPQVAPPVIARPGVLRAAVALDYPPFGAKVEGAEVGLDVDVAAAIAERLGLKLEIVEVSSERAIPALTEDEVDIVLAALPLSEGLLTEATFAGSYIDDAPAFFTSTDETLTVASLGGRRPAVQERSAAYWILDRRLGSEVASSYPTLRAAFEALEGGHVEVVAGDAVVGAYLARDFTRVRLAGQLEPAVPLGVVVAKDATDLESVVREALDALSADGVLDAVRAKWAGDLPKLEVRTAEDP
ncbi:MAG: amino acid ABC transporter substrate-binding protein [Coriobacteriia bacterium]|nr:amino acid ABC transporter substrate-binding protein [Coriobacteriia bacterium]